MSDASSLAFQQMKRNKRRMREIIQRKMSVVSHLCNRLMGVFLVLSLRYHLRITEPFPKTILMIIIVLALLSFSPPPLFFYFYFHQHTTMITIIANESKCIKSTVLLLLFPLLHFLSFLISPKGISSTHHKHVSSICCHDGDNRRNRKK